MFLIWRKQPTTQPALQFRHNTRTFLVAKHTSKKCCNAIIPARNSKYRCSDPMIHCGDDLQIVIQLCVFPSFSGDNPFADRSGAFTNHLDAFLVLGELNLLHSICTESNHSFIPSSRTQTLHHSLHAVSRAVIHADWCNWITQPLKISLFNQSCESRSTPADLQLTTLMMMRMPQQLSRDLSEVENRFLWWSAQLYWALHNYYIIYRLQFHTITSPSPDIDRVSAEPRIPLWLWYIKIYVINQQLNCTRCTFNLHSFPR